MDPEPIALAGCFTAEGGDDCDSVGVATQTSDVLVSPDGRHVYAAGGHDIQGFARAADGALTRLAAPGGCLTEMPTIAGCVTTGILSGAVTDLAISPDGATLYAAATFGILTLHRDPATGSLTPRGCMGSAQGCIGVNPPGGSSGLVVSPDGTSVHSRTADRLLSFERDPSTGLLTQLAGAGGCSAEGGATGCGVASGLAGLSYQPAVSPDGSSVYVASVDGVAVFERNLETGVVFQAVPGPEGGCVTHDGSSSAAMECESLGAAGPALENARSTAVTPSGKHVIVAGADGAVVFSRSMANGTLQLTDCVYREVLAGCQHRPGVGGIGLSIAPAGDSVVLPSAGGHQWFALDDDAGTLTPMPNAQGCWSGTGQTGCLALPASSGSFSQSAWSSDGTSVYTAAGALAQLRVERPPVCAPISTSTPHDTAVTFAASCADPNGDAVTVSIVGEPTSGSASVHADEITYVPAPGFSGTITFFYAGAAAGDESASAPISVHVAAAPPATGTPPPGTPPGPPSPPGTTPPPGTTTPPGTTAGSPDTDVTIDIATRRIVLNRNARGSVRLTCPTTEVSGPCHGQVKLKTRERFPFGGRNYLVPLAARRYTLAAGRSMTVKLTLGDAQLRLVERKRSARRIWIQVSVLDSADNRVQLRKRARLVLP